MLITTGSKPNADPRVKIRSEYFIGNPTVTRVVFFPNHINQRVGRVVLINHHEWRE